MKQKSIQDIKKGGDTVVRITSKKLVSRNDVLPDKSTDIKKHRFIAEESSHKRFRTTPTIPHKNTVRRSVWIGLFLAIVLCGGYYLATRFEHSKITLDTKKQSFTFTGTSFTASKDTTSPIHFEIMIVSDTTSKDMILSDSQNVANKATGTITLYNTYSSKPVALGAGTFLADTNGKTYKLDKVVTIPGFTTVSKVITPGKIQATITAFLPGDAYNGTPTDFTITAYKGTSKAKKIYAKAVTPLTGGAQGLVYMLDAQGKGTLDALAQTTVKTALLKKAIAQVPPEYILYPDAYTYTYSVSSDTLSPLPHAKIDTVGTISAVLLRRDDLIRALVQNQVKGIEDTELAEVNIPKLENLTFAWANTVPTITKDLSAVDFKISGTVDGLWIPDMVALKASVAGIQKNMLQEIFAQDKGIIGAHINIFPPWQGFVSKDPSKIDILEK